MIRHIVMFKLKNYSNEHERLSQINTLIETFSKLKQKINVIQDYDVKKNEGNNPSAYDVIINSTFKTWEDLKTYANHAHHKACITKNKIIAKDKAVIDYQF